MATAIQQYDPSGSYLTQWREPEEVLAEATKAATALKRVVSMKKNPVMFNGEQYLEREDWGTVAKFYGCTAKSIETRYVEYGNVRGFEATAIVIDRNGNEVGRAESLCLDDEENWGKVPKYEWQDELDEQGKKIWVDGKDGKKRPKGKRVQIGEVAKPLFQLKSMAQTRAEAKALKGVFSWVVVLAGYRPTPAEEMTGNENLHERDPEREPIQQPQRTSQQAQAATNSQSNRVEVSGVIESTKTGNNGALWLSLKSGSIVMVLEKLIDSDMKPGMFLKCRGIKMHKEKLDYCELEALVELTAVQDGDPVPDQKAEATDGQQPPATANAAVQGIVDNGTLKPASEIEQPKTIGKKRSQRIYALCGTYKAQNNGFNEAEIKKILQTFEPPLEHLSDVQVGVYEQFEKWAMGSEDWRNYWKDDPLPE